MLLRDTCCVLQRVMMSNVGTDRTVLSVTPAWHLQGVRQVYKSEQPFVNDNVIVALKLLLIDDNGKLYELFQIISEKP